MESEIRSVHFLAGLLLLEMQQRAYIVYMVNKGQCGIDQICACHRGQLHPPKLQPFCVAVPRRQVLKIVSVECGCLEPSELACMSLQRGKSGGGKCCCVSTKCCCALGYLELG